MKTKGIIIVLIMMSSIFLACSSQPESDEDTILNEQMNHEADSIETVNEEMEQTKMDLKKSTEEVDELLNDL